MAPDIFQIFIKGGGIFISIGSKKYPAKLRMLYEVVPFAKLVEAAGGMSDIGDGTSCLDVPLTGWEQKCGIIVGSKNDVEMVVELNKKHKDDVVPEQAE